MRLRVTEAIALCPLNPYLGAVCEMALDEFAAINDAEDGTVEEVRDLAVGESIGFTGGLVERLA